MTFKNNKLKTLLFTIIIIAFAMGCEEKHCYNDYQATFPFNMYAKSDTINIGDTISLKVRFTRAIFNQAPSEDFYLPDEFVEHDLNIVILDHDSVDLNSIYSTGGYSSFEIVNNIGHLGGAYFNSLVEINYEITHDSAFGDFQLIARDTGVFVFTIHDHAFYRYKNELTQNYDITIGHSQCYEYYWHGLFLNQNENNNYYIIQKNNAFNHLEHFEYFDPDNRMNKNSINDRKHDLEFGSFSVVVRE